MLRINCAPIGVVLTIAAAGSEMSNSSVITNDETGLKRSYHTEISRPRFAIMNPEFTMTLPEYQTAMWMHRYNDAYNGALFYSRRKRIGTYENKISRICKC